jgi:hypothetical protein
VLIILKSDEPSRTAKSKMIVNANGLRGRCATGELAIAGENVKSL